MPRLAELYSTVSLKGLGRSTGKLRGFRGVLSKTSASMSRLGAVALRVAKVGLVAFVAALAGGVVAAAKFQKQLAMVSTMLDAKSMPLMKGYAIALDRMAREFGEGTATLAKGLYDILSASIPAAQAIDVLTVSVRAAKAGFTDTAVSADALTTILNSYRVSADMADIVSDKLFATVKRGKITFPELASSIGKVAATAATAGLSLDELLASIATITRAGVRSDQAMVAVVGTLRTFLKPSTEGAALAMDKFGLELNTATLRAIGLTGVFKKLKNATAEQLAVIFPNIRGLKGVAAAMMDLGGLGKDVNLMLTAQGATAEAYAKSTDTLAHSWDKLKQEFLSTARALGTAVAPAVRKLVEGVSTGLQGLRTFGGKLWGFLRNKLLAIWVSMIVAVKNWRTELDIAWTAAKLGAVTFWEELKFTFMDRIPSILEWFGRNWQNVFKDAWNFFMTVAKNAVENVRRLFVALVKWLATIDWGGIWDGFKQGIIDLSIWMFDLVTGAFTKLYEWIKSIDWKEALKGVAAAPLLPIVLGKKLVDMMKPMVEKTMEDIIDPTWKLKFKPLTEGFKTSITEGLDLPERERTEVERRLTKRLSELSKKLKNAFDAEWRKVFGTPPPAKVGVDAAGKPVPIAAPVRAGAGAAAGAGGKSGAWSGIADVWKRLQAGAVSVSPELKEAKKQTGLLSKIHGRLGVIQTLRPEARAG